MKEARQLQQQKISKIKNLPKNPTSSPLCNSSFQNTSSLFSCAALPFTAQLHLSCSRTVKSSSLNRLSPPKKKTKKKPTIKISIKQKEGYFVAAIRAWRHCAFPGFDSRVLCCCNHRATHMSSFYSCRESSRHN